MREGNDRVRVLHDRKDVLSPSVRPRRRRMQLVALLVVSIVALFAARPVLSFFHAVSVMYAFTTQGLPISVHVFRKLVNWETVRTETSIKAQNGKGENGEIKLRIYAPRNRTDAPVIVLVHGLAADGLKDRSMNTLAQQLAADGFRVVIPEIATEKRRLMSEDALSDIGDTIHWASHLNGKPISVMGVSFGGGLLLRTASMRQYAGDVRYLLCISGYNSLTRLGHFYIGDVVTGPDGQVYKEAPQVRGPLLIAYQHPEEMFAADQVKSAIPVMTTLLDGKSGEANENRLIAELSNTARQQLEDVRAARDPATHQLFEDLLQRHELEYDELSPHRNLTALKAGVYVLHGVTDSYTPVEEAAWNCREIEQAGADCTMQSTPWLLHAILDKRAPLREKIRVGIFVARFFNAASR